MQHNVAHCPMTQQVAETYSSKRRFPPIAFLLRIPEQHNLSAAAVRDCPSKKEEVDKKCSGNSE